MIRSSAADSIMTITLDRPAQRNALTTEMIDALVHAICSCSGETRALLLNGSGNVFCAGFDLALCNQTRDGSVLRHLLQSLFDAVKALRDLHCPVVIACQGGAIAGGCALLAGADFVVADRKAVFGYPVLRLGLSPAVSLPTLARAVGDGPARARALDVDLIDAVRAHQISLIHQVVDTPSDIPAAALEVAQVFATKPLHAMQITRDWLRKVAFVSPEAMKNGLEASLRTAGSPEQLELLTSLLSAKKKS